MIEPVRAKRRAFPPFAVTCAAAVLIAFAAPSPAVAEAPGVLCLFRSSEGFSATDNPVKRYCAPHLESFGLRPLYHDIDAGLPPAGTAAIRAVVSWYRAPSMRSRDLALSYIDYLGKLSAQGKKIVIINSFGAYGCMEGAGVKWLDSKTYNALFEKLGFRHMGCATTDRRVISIAYKNSAMVEKQASQSVAASRFYQRFIPHNSPPGFKSWLTLKRKGRDPRCGNRLGDGRSTVIFTGDFGGFALERYVERDGKLLLNTEAFLRHALFGERGFQKVALVSRRAEGRTADNARRALESAGIAYQEIDAASAPGMVSRDLDIFTAVLVAGSLDDALAELLAGYLARGGAAVVLDAAAPTPRTAALLGVARSGGSQSGFNAFSTERGFLVNGRVLSLRLENLSPRDVSIADGSVLARASRDSESTPAAWMRRTGPGRLLVWNAGELVADRAFRGLVVQSLHAVSPGLVSTVANIGLIGLELSGSIFDTALANRILADLRDTQRQYRIALTGFVAIDDARGAPGERLAQYAREAKWELGADCAGDLPRAGKVSEKWAALRGAGEHAASWLVRRPVSAPEAAALAGSGPALIMSPFRLNGGRGAEFSAVRGSPVVFPYMSEAFSPDGHGQLCLLDSLHCMGAAGHLLTLASVERAREGDRMSAWTAELGRFTALLDGIAADFPWLRWMSASAAARELARYKGVSVSARRSGNVITVRTLRAGGDYSYFRTRIEPGRRIARLAGCRLVNIYRESGDYIFKTASPECRVILR
jgi:hypothetical protein